MSDRLLIFRCRDCSSTILSVVRDGAELTVVYSQAPNRVVQLAENGRRPKVKGRSRPRNVRIPLSIAELGPNPVAACSKHEYWINVGKLRLLLNDGSARTRLFDPTPSLIPN